MILQIAEEITKRDNDFSLYESLDIYKLIPIVISLIAVSFAVIAYIERRKSKHINEEVIKAARDSFETKKTSLKLKKAKEELDRERESLKSTSEQINALKKQIENDIPKAARIAVLKDRFEESTIHMQNYYNDLIKTKKQLELLNEDIDLSDELLKAVESEIQPKHIIKEKISNIQNWLTIITGLGSFSFLIFTDIIGLFFLTLTIPLIVKLTNLILLKQYGDKTLVRKITLSYSIVFLGIILFGSGIFILILEVTKKYFDEFIISVPLLFILGIIFFILGIKKVRKIQPTTNNV